MENKPRLLRITTVPISLKLLLRGQLAYMRQQGFEVWAASADGPERASIMDEGIPHHVVPFTRRITPVVDVIALIRLILLMRYFRPAIVHTHTPKAGLLGMMAAWLCRVPVRLHTVAGLPLMEARGWKRQLLWITERLTYRCATEVYVNSRGLRDYLLSRLRPAKRMGVLGEGSTNGIDAGFFCPSEELRARASAMRKQLNIPPTELVFGFVGRIVRDKGIDELLSAFVTVSATIRCRLLLIGPFEDHLDPISLESWQIINSNASVLCVGYQEDVRPALMASDIFVLPSYREGFPNVVLQACCLELPCIVTDINGSNEIVESNRTGLVVKPKDAASLAEAMKRLALNPGLRRELGVASRQSVARRFDQAYIWTAVHEEYRKHLRMCTKA